MAAFTGAFPESLFEDGIPPAPSLELWFWNGSGGATLRWKPTTTDITSYTLERSNDGGVTWGTTTNISPNTLFSGYQNQLVAGLTIGQTYTWRIRATNQWGTSLWSNWVSGISLNPPTTPLNLVATPGNGSVSLSWDPPTSTGGGTIVGYRVQYKQSAATTWTTGSSNTFSPYVVTGLPSGVAHDFRVAAQNESIAGSYATTSATPTSNDETATGSPVLVAVSPQAEASLDGSQEATGSILALSTSIPAATASLTGAQSGTATPITVAVSVPIAPALRDGEFSSEADIIITAAIPTANAELDGSLASDADPITVTVSVPTASASIAGSEDAEGDPVIVSATVQTATGEQQGELAANGNLTITATVPATEASQTGSLDATADPTVASVSIPTGSAALTGSQDATAEEVLVTATIPTVTAQRDGEVYSEADLTLRVLIAEAPGTASGTISATTTPTVISLTTPPAHAFISVSAQGNPVVVRVVTSEAPGQAIMPALGGMPLDEDSGPGLVVIDTDAFAELDVPVAVPSGGLLDPISGDWLLEPTESDPLAEEGVTPVVGAVAIPANPAQGIGAEYELPELAPPMPAKALVRVSPQMPSPASRLGRLGLPRPNQFVPDTITTEVYGRVRVVIEGRDVTYHRGVPCEVISITDAEPFGSLSAVVRFPSLSPFQALTGKNRVFTEGNDIKITVVSVDGTQTLATLFEGYIVERESEVTSDDVGVTVQCQGALYYADFSMAQPKLRYPYADIGRKIASRLNPNKRRRWRRMGLDEFQTGIMTTHRGSWEPVLTGFVGDLLAMATTDDGQSQWTLHLDPGRKPVLRLKDRTTIHHTVTLGTPGVGVSLRRDVTSGVSTIYGQGVDDKNRAYANLKIPFYNPETPDFIYPYGDPGTVMTIGSTDAGTVSGDGVTRVQRRLRSAGFRVKVTGTYNNETAEAVREWQRSTGGDVTGTLGGQTWASLMMVGSSAGAYKMAYYAPFASLSKVEPWLINADGSRTVRNPNYDDDAFRIERFRVFPDGTSKRDASRAAAAELKRDKDPGWIGTVTLTVDPQEGSRWGIRAGQNILVKGWEGSNLLLHIASVTKSPNGGTVTLEVDSKARDLLTLDAIVRRDRDNLSPGARRRGAKQTAANIAPNPIVDSELTGWVIKHAVEAQKWTVLRVPLGIDGSIVGVELDTDPMSRFAVALFTDKISPAKLKRLVGNPLMYRIDELRPFPGDEATANELARLGWIDTIGGPEQAAGFWPGAESEGDGLTGKHRDNGISISFESRRPPFIWIATWSDSATFLEGRLIRDPQRW